MRRANPDRVREAQRAGFRAQMVNYWHVPLDQADEALDAWEAEAAARGIYATKVQLVAACRPLDSGHDQASGG